MRRLHTALSLIGCLLLAGTLPTHAQIISIRLIVDTATAIPDGMGVFLGFVPDGPPTVPPGPGISEDGEIVFFGVGVDGQQGVYRVVPEGPPNRVADLATAIPDGAGAFTAFAPSPFISDGHVVFVGYGASGQHGVYLLPGDPISPPSPIRIADLTTSIPNGTDTFTWFMPIAYNDGDDVAFVGYGTGGQWGVYARFTDALNVIADTNTAIPAGSGNFVQSPPNPIRVYNGNVAFIGLGAAGQAGVYLSESGLLTRVADTSMPVPNGNNGAFQSFSTVSYDGWFLAFAARGTELEHGVYKSLPNGPPQRVADLMTPVPGGTGTFIGFGQVVVDPGIVVFEGFSDDGAGGTRRGLYTDFSGTLTKIIATGDLLAGKQVTDLSVGPGAFTGNRVAFVAVFADGSEAITRASLCEALGFAGFEGPIGGADATGGTFADPVRAFKLKSTVPVKMTLTTCDGAPVISGVHTIQLIKFSDGTTSEPAIDASPTDAATIGNAFRLTDAATGAWHFNLTTKSLTRGIWQIRAIARGRQCAHGVHRIEVAGVTHAE